MRRTSDGYIIGVSFKSAFIILSPGAFMLLVVIALLIEMRPRGNPAIFFGSLGVVLAVLLIFEGYLIASLIRRRYLLITGTTGVTYYPVGSEPFTVPWSEVGAMYVTEGWVGHTRMRKLTLGLRPSPAGNPDEVDRIDLPESRLPSSAMKCLRKLAERHREQIALNAIAIYDEPQIKFGSF